MANLDFEMMSNYNYSHKGLAKEKEKEIVDR
jgi:hypothetical protein